MRDRHGLDGVAGGHQRPPAQDHEQDRRHRRVDEEACRKGRQRRQGQACLLNHAVGDAAIDADGRKAPGLRAMDDHQAHQQRVDMVSEGKAQRDGRHDRHRAGADCAHGGQQRGNAEHDPGNRPDAALDRAHRHAHQPVDRAVVLRQGEQPGDAHQGQEQPAGKARKDVLGRLRGQQRADQKGPDKGQNAHVYRPDGRHDEHQDQGIDGNQMWCHAVLPFLHELGDPPPHESSN